MKKLLATIAAAIVGFIATPNTAEAGVHISFGSGSSYVSGRASCGCPIYTKRVVRGYDCYRRPIYSYVRVPFNCNCRSHRAPVVRHGYSSRCVTPPRHVAPHRGHHHRNHGSHGRSNSRASHDRGRYHRGR
ncbi:hypothetical protein AAFN60_03055 [Roseibacillus persicicus]|uniref:hypothetical protein n=1 Tax=Roseibacillus persicicus TaxID=454148 RepID=UPI001675A8E4|nr:hypothetical protein [Roseibacillus persicicus]